MGYTIDIDTGGTFTDCFAHGQGKIRTLKVPTTPHDLTVCFLDAIRATATAFGVNLHDFMYQVDIIRFSNTIGTNTIIQRDGSKVGLLVTAGMGRMSPTSDVEQRAPLVADDMVIGLQEDTSESGEIILKPEPGHILSSAQALIDRGAQCLVVALNNSDCNAANEHFVRATIKQEYPRDYLGSVPVFLSSDISPRPGAEERINSVVLNGYIHAKLVLLLYKAGEDLRRLKYPNNLFIVHNNGSVARVARTRAINTYNSGPAAGLLGAQKVAELYGVHSQITTDMGGTSFDIGYIIDGQPALTLAPDVEGFPCNLPMVRIRAFGAAGGSIASVRDGELSVGPQSAGAVPGPASFDLGGDQPTLTDANLVLGILDSEFFLGGSMQLDMDKARKAIDEKVAQPLGVSVEQAASLIRDNVEKAMGREVAKVKRKFTGPDDPLMVAYGGAGAAHACNIASVAGMQRIVVTPYSAVSSAFSSSLMEAGHQYYRRINLSCKHKDLQERILQAVTSMRVEAERDMRGERFAIADMRAEVQLLVQLQGSPEIIRRFTPESIEQPDTIVRLIEATGGDSRALVTTAGLFSSAAIPHFSFMEKAPAGKQVGQARKGCRPVFLSAEYGFQDVDIYTREKMGYGHELAGPVLIESMQTTLLVPRGWRIQIDQYNNALLEQA